MFNRRLKERLRYFELRMGQVEDLAIHAVEEGYAAKGSPAEGRFKVLADIAGLALRDESTYAFEHDGHIAPLGREKAEPKA